ncbi:hypothetical protein DFH08DRAFT_978997 [Mycena albidolilacea]|uniref:CxC2-like cysteine cluster KDZ transposase-associated domain-containing protein n=1 Tax=Mycena albidolilacea TaxID=1033008 RepID=A0AAD7E6Y4_9AGAR|nr:hypothetical protein DFH08DRAFT_978997 [Mycena albidolilacea]
MKKTSGPSRKRTKNVYSLRDFGHSLQEAPRSTPVARAGNLSADGRRADIQHIPLESQSRPSSSATPPVDYDDDWLDMPSEVNNMEPMSRARKRKWYATTDDALRHWVANFRDAYLRVLVTREGRMGQDSTCSCGEHAKYRCTECFGGRIYCQGCIVEAHRLRPLCRIEGWNGAFFDRKELRSLGLRVQLGHTDNQRCLRAHPGRDKFVVVAPNGLHHVAVDFCQCRLSSSAHRWEQLLSYGWYPATPDNPQSAVTISTLRLFHAVSLQGKTTVYHFFNALAKITDNTGSRAFKRRYQLVLRVVRQWRNLRALKRGGMGNDPDRTTAETREGELAVECIACPKPGVNLPEGWEKAPPEMQYLYAIFLAIDACFRLKRKKVSSWSADPSIQDGWAYFVRHLEYSEFVKLLGEQKEMSTCTGLAALDHANTKYSQGYAATGCGMITCGRHETVPKNGVADLQAGEKYGNMDYVWVKNLKERLLKMPPALRVRLADYVLKFVIPKLHILGHLKLCQELFSLLYMLGAAQADMEGIERIWSSSGLMGASTREMGPGSRQDTLDDFWHYWNWNKVVGMGLTLRTRFLKATKELARQKAALEEFSEHQQEEVPIWRKAVNDFETGASPVNPYQLPPSGPTLREVELELAREEQAKERNSATVPGDVEETMTQFLMLRLEIEGQQRQLAADMLQNRSPTAKELTEFVTRRTRMTRQIKKLRLLQRKYSPGALQHLATATGAADAADAAEAEHTPLLLPSALTPSETHPPLSVPGLATAEARLRDGQCSESLDLIRHGLTVKKRLQTYKKLNARRQHQNTRSRGLVDNQQRKIDLAAGTYRQARSARLALAHAAGPSDWRLLDKGDLRMLEDEEEARKRKQRAMKGKRKEAAQLDENGEVRGVPGMGEKTRLISWIWFSAGQSGGIMQENMHEGVRVEWCKAYARVKRWKEEVLLLQEEMVRCLRTLEWQATVWDERAKAEHYRGKIVYGAIHLEGAIALAGRQAALRRKLSHRFRQLWSSLTSAIEGSSAAASDESSGVDEPDSAHGNGSDVDSGEEDKEPAARRDQTPGGQADAGGSNAEGAGEDEEEGSADTDGEEIATRVAQMNELLAIQFASTREYEDDF